MSHAIILQEISKFEIPSVVFILSGAKFGSQFIGVDFDAHANSIELNSIKFYFLNWKVETLNSGIDLINCIPKL